MTRRLLLLRHAEAAGPPGGDFSEQADLARALTAEGRMAASRCGAWLRANALAPDLVLCSPARRTRETLAALEPFQPPPVLPTRFCPDIYEAPPSALLACIRQASVEARTLLLVGHNPGISALARWLDSQADALEAGFATASLAVFHMWGSESAEEDTGWAQCDATSLTLDTFARP
ncbi:SixA phosphatase family protein [Acetobacter orleanensis]|uniref:Phosphoglycerate mutase n=1 Tax=Acetobacter orleanensis TaxID=104099 RepID=A0A4Y3TIG3_9PROT|nr:histidine phosphatase family protein [Acetobacter orleanensis]KXV62062.1 phosphohistidine phosphatase [Acetobacter orleanensis]PCD80398.1 phosphohistidine phosphatase [Acetobacter orleanensis]GAN67535.1 phosphohistidine phosphatas [Acetobacter orleanensis JCM 7639]GBR26277.1 phosphohistidine phosphatase [Acetobacter orleanensis NRIC 0473]GEB81752.1 phosphoglycerate mutase [Acetobacter orleanensis]